MTKQKTVESKTTLVEFLLDETGSMSQFLSQTINGFKDFVDEQRTIDELCLFTLTKFDSDGLKTPYIDLDINMVPYLTEKTYIPNAFTNLNDSIAYRINARYEALKNWDTKPRVLFVCMTDGEDNSSRLSIDFVRDKITEAMNDDWMFVFLGAYEGAHIAAKKLGFPIENIKCFQGTKIHETLKELSTATKAYRVADVKPTSFYAEI